MLSDWVKQYSLCWIIWINKNKYNYRENLEISLVFWQSILRWPHRYAFTSRLRNNKNYNRKNRRSHGAMQSNIQFGKCFCGTARALAVNRSPPCWLFIYHHSTIIATDEYFSVSHCSIPRPTRSSIGRSISETLVARLWLSC